MHRVLNSIKNYKEYKDVRSSRLSGMAILYQTGIMLLFMLMAFIVGVVFRTEHLAETNTAIVYLLSVLLIARFTSGYVFGIIASLISAFSFNFFFTEPYYALSIKTPSYIIAFIIMTITAFITSALTAHAKNDYIQARLRETEAKVLYTMTKRLSEASDNDAIAGIALSTISEILHCQAACLCFDESGQVESSMIQQLSPQKQIRRKLDDAAAVMARVEAGGAEFTVGEEFVDWPIRGRDALLGVIRIPAENAAQLKEFQRRMLRSIIENTALAMDRFRAIQDRLKSNEEIAQERYRGNLLRAISHDLRTPLASIMGSADMLRHMSDPADPRYALMENIHHDANWLHALVENILGLTRLQEGRLVLNKQEEAVEEIVGAAVRILGRRAPDREIKVHVPDKLLLVPMDAKLIGQVLVNLLDNAHKHTPMGGEISIHVEKDEENQLARFTIRDEGEGIAAADLPHLFQMFYTAKRKQADAQLGIGLGLAICEAIVIAHGGTIEGRNNHSGTGAQFSFTLPLEVQAHD